MNAHDWFIEHRTEFAAGVLTDDEMARFAAHLQECESCPAAVARIAGELRWLPMGAAPIAPRPGLQAQILDHALARTPRSWRRWSVPIGIAASLICGLGGWVIGRGEGRSEPQVAVAPPSVEDPRVAALRDTLSIMREAAQVMQAKITMHGKDGGMVIFDEPRTHRWNVVVHGLPAAPVNERYQFWFICADGMVRGATVQVSPTQPALFTTGMPAPSCRVTGAALTVEPAGDGSPLPRGATLAHVLL